MPFFKPKQLAVISLRAEDVSKTAHFYRDIIGLALLPHHNHRPAFDLGGTFLIIVEGQPPPVHESEATRFPVLAWEVEDLGQAVEHLQAHNVDLPWGIKKGRGTRWVMFFDPAGNLIEFVEANEAICA
jgi:catechol-2,3-dioxygenase